MLKVLTMQIGEYEADPLLFTCDKGDITYPFSTYLMVVLMIVFVTIILQNMLVSRRWKTLSMLLKRMHFLGLLEIDAMKLLFSVTCNELVSC